ncbi:MAG: hypothetical protein Q9166_004394 [cf. Caloplaca sp. 2 TL-2023]
MAPSTLGLSCACRQITGVIDISNSSPPLGLELCHCSGCRHVSGQLAISCFTCPRAPDGGPPTLRITKGEPVAYKTSERLIRYFCGQCGATIYMHIPESGDYEIATGVLDQAEGILTFKQHIFVEGTKDGGLSSWLEGPAWNGWAEKSEKYEPPRRSAVQNRPPKDGDPNEDHPFSTWWLRANGTKYFAGTCACNSCRLSTGFDIQAWAFVPKSNIRQMDGKELDFSMGTLKRYSHTKWGNREFCGTCGATVFWHSDERPGIIDISAGLLDAEEGARAEEWLEWGTDRVSFEECANNKGLVGGVSRGLRKWGEE